MTIRAFFSAVYAPDSVPHFRRLTETARASVRSGLAEVHSPAPVDGALLNRVHSAEYVDAFLTGKDPLASSLGVRWTEALRDAVLAMLGGQIEAARWALTHGVAMHIARGFRHARFHRGDKLCAVNGLALLASALPETRVCVVDCGEAGANGTEQYTTWMPNLLSMSLFGHPAGCEGGRRSWTFDMREQADGFTGYLRALVAVEALIDRHRPELIVFKAGVDSHHRHPASTLRLTSRDLHVRDRFIFEMAHDRRIPVLFIVGGDHPSALRSARLNLGTLQAAHRVFFGGRSRIA